MYLVQDAHSFWDWIFFVLLIIIGSFFLTKLCRVVIVTKFLEIKNREASLQLNKEQNGFKQYKKMSSIKIFKFNLIDSWHMIKILFKAIDLGKLLKQLGKEKSTEEPNDSSIYMLFNDQISIENAIKAPIARPETSIITSLSTESLNIKDKDKTSRFKRIKSIKNVRKYSYRLISDSRGVYEDYFLKFKRKLTIISKSNWLSKSITVLIIIDTLLICTEHHNQPEYLTVMIEYFNVLFTILFTFVILCSITAIGFWAYIKDKFHALDFLIGFLRY